MIVEQCQPLRHSSSQSQKQQCGHEEMEYHLQEHNYTHGDENSEMEIILVKQEVRVCVLATIKFIFPFLSS